MKKTCDASKIFHIPVFRSEESNRYREPLTDDRWQADLRDIKARLSSVDSAIARSLALSVKEGIEWLDAPMTKYCRLTYLNCKDPCCTGRSIFYNYADILYLLALGQYTPPGQTRATESNPCRYLTPSGCQLPRIYRPYVCVWFLCDDQINLFNQEPLAFQRRFISIQQDIRKYRLQLEALFERE
jgi:hypothetical protein